MDTKQRMLKAIEGLPDDAKVEDALERLGTEPVHSFESLYEADRAAREAAAELVEVKGSA